MNGKLERILKEQLDNYELPYENGAWEQFSKRLDGTPSTPFYRKWWFAASVGTVLVGSATYFTLSSKESATQQQTAKTELTSTGNSNAASQQPENTVVAGSSQASNDQTPSDQTSANPSAVSDQTYTPGKSVTANHTTYSHNGQSTGTPGPGTVTSNGAPAGTPGHTTPDVQFVKLQLPSSVCQDELFTIENPNDQAVRVVYPGGKTKTIQGKQSLEIRAAQSGTIQVETGRSVETIIVNEPSSNLFIDVDASVLYENGIPTLKFNVIGADNGIEWESNIAARTSDRNHLIVHPFTENEVTVKAITHDQNGCKVTETEKIRISDPYNLLAPTGFTPSSGDVRTNTFIPYALTQRETPFEMIIMDPNNMTVLFTTADASQGWTGLDGRSGQQVQAGTTWLWKVVMKNPLPGEPREYKGLITVTGK